MSDPLKGGGPPSYIEYGHNVGRAQKYSREARTYGEAYLLPPEIRLAQLRRRGVYLNIYLPRTVERVACQTTGHHLWCEHVAHSYLLSAR